MENQDTYVVQDPQEIPLDFDHYKTFTAALADAIQRCMVWREFETGTPYTGKDLYEFAQRHDEQFVLNEDEFYMVTLEGAIGLSPGLEWMTKWTFVPMESGEERDHLLEDMKEKLRKETDATPKICPHCGAQMKANLKFCTNCGTSLNPEPTEGLPPQQKQQEEMDMEQQADESVDTMTEQERLNRQYAEVAAYIGHDHYLMQALHVAFSRCKAWRMTDGGEAVSINKLFHFSKKYDEEHPLEEGMFFIVTIEGAIGLSFGQEWLTQWLFIPMEPCEERDRMMEQLKEKLEQHEHQEDREQPTPQPVMKFCTHCGKPINPAMKFCTNCGARLTNN